MRGWDAKREEKIKKGKRKDGKRRGSHPTRFEQKVQAGHGKGEDGQRGFVPCARHKAAVFAMRLSAETQTDAGEVGRFGPVCSAVSCASHVHQQLYVGRVPWKLPKALEMHGNPQILYGTPYDGVMIGMTAGKSTTSL